MKNILTPLIALFLSLHAHATVHTVKFVDAHGNEPRKQEYKDQHCQLVNCDDNTVIEGNNVQLAVGDTLEIKTPKSHSFFFPYNYSIGTALEMTIFKLKAVSVQDDVYNNCFNNINLLAIAPGIEEMDIYFTEKVNYFNAGYDPIEGSLGHITITVVE